MPIFYSKPLGPTSKRRRLVENDQDIQIKAAADSVTPVSGLIIDKYKSLAAKAADVASMASSIASGLIPITDITAKDAHKVLFQGANHDVLTLEQYQQLVAATYENLPTDITTELSRDLSKGSFTTTVSRTSDSKIFGLSELSQYMALAATAWQAISLFAAKDIKNATTLKTPQGSESAAILAMTANALNLFASYYPEASKGDLSSFTRDVTEASQNGDVNGPLGSFIKQVLAGSQVDVDAVGLGQYKAYRTTEARKTLIKYAGDHVIDNPTKENMAWMQYAIANDLALEENGIVVYKDGIVPELECPFDAHQRLGNDVLDTAAAVINFRLTRQTACCIAAALLGKNSLNNLNDAISTLDLFASILDKAKFLLRLDLQVAWANARALSVNRMTNWARSHIMRTAYKQFSEIITKTKDSLNDLLDESFHDNFVKNCPLLDQLVSMVITVMEKLKKYMLKLLADFLDYADKKHKKSKEALAKMADLVYIDQVSRILKAISQLLKDAGSCAEDDVQNVISNAINTAVAANISGNDPDFSDSSADPYRGFLSADNFVTSSGVVVPSIIKLQKLKDIEQELGSAGRCLSDSRVLLGSGKSLAEVTRTLIERVADARTQDELRRRRGSDVS